MTHKSIFRLLRPHAMAARFWRWLIGVAAVCLIVCLAFASSDLIRLLMALDQASPLFIHHVEQRISLSLSLKNDCLLLILSGGGAFTLAFRVIAHQFARQKELMREAQTARAQAESAHAALAREVAEREKAVDNYRSLFENAAEGIFRSTVQGSYITVNPALARMYGYESAGEMLASLCDIGRQLYVDPARRDEFARLIREDGHVSGFEAQITRRDGSIIWISENARVITDDRGMPCYYEGFVNDITQRKALEDEQERLLAEALLRADHDPLTGLLNHRAFHKRLEEEADRAQRAGTTLTVVMMDLNNFKFFNDAYGHVVGDDVLRQVANALRGICRSYDTLARFGGDEFALLLPSAGAQSSEELVARINAVVAGIAFHPPGSSAPIPLGVAAGVAVFPTEAAARLEAVTLADERLRQAKTGGGEAQSEVQRLCEHLTRSIGGFAMLNALVTAVDAKDRYTRRHSEDVLNYSLTIARILGLDDQTKYVLQVAALLHDVGKIGVPDRILRKPGALTAEEYEAIQQHALMGAVMVGAVPGLENTLEGIRHHHERWDGKGYPYGLHGAETPLLARIMAVADAYSAMTTDRPYRMGMPVEKALGILEAGAGSQWDPDCIAAFLQAHHQAEAATTATAMPLITARF